MARRFVAASSQQLTNSNPPVTASPCTLACWCRPTQTVNRSWLLGVFNSGGGNFLALNITSGNVQAYQFDFVTTGQANTAGSVTTNVWNHAAAVFTSGTAETAYLNGTGTSGSQAAVTPTGIDTTRIGQNVTEFYDGDVAEAAIWNVALSATEVAILARGVSPMLVRPSAIVAYWPLLHGYSPEIDIFGHHDLTLSNAPTLVSGPALWLPIGLRRHRLAHPTANPTIASIQAQLNAANAAIGSATSDVATLTPSSTVDAINAQLASATASVSSASALVNVLGPSPTPTEIAAIQTQLTAALVAINNALALLNTILGITGNEPTFFFEVLLNGVWIDLTPDVISRQVDIAYGIQGDGPMDSVASSGTCTFQLRNDAHGSKPQGYYSPNNANVRSGWTFGVPFRVRALYNNFFYSRFYGRISSILPDTGTHRRRQVTVVAYDIMRTLAEVDVQQVAIQVNQSEDQVIAAVLASLPSSEQPLALDLDVGSDSLGYALDNVGSSSKALSVLADVAHSSFYLIAQKGNGTLIGRSRYTRTTVVSSFTFNNDLTELEVPSDLTSVYNLVKLTSHPRSIDTSPTTVLYSMTGTVPSIPPNSTVTFWGTFNDPTNDQRLIGGLNTVTPLVAYPTTDYDYAGNTLQDGSGSDVTSSLSVVATAFATTTKFDITNSSSVSVYLVAPATTTPMLRIRGKGVYDRGPQQFQSYIPQTYGTRMFTADLPYQGDPNVAQAACEYIQAAYNSLTNRASKLSFVAKASPAKLFFALTVEPGDRITITETMTGLSGVDSIVQSVALSITQNHILCSLGLAPANAQKAWLWGVAGKSEWDQTTFYGF